MAPVYAVVNVATRLVDIERGHVLQRGISWRQGHNERGSILEGLGRFYLRKPTLVALEIFGSGAMDYVRVPLGFTTGQGMHMTFRRWAVTPEGKPLLGTW